MRRGSQVQVKLSPNCCIYSVSGIYDNQSRIGGVSNLNLKGMPLSAQEVATLVAAANTALAELQGEFGRRNRPEARVSFPRGFIRTAAQLRGTLPDLGAEVQRRNASYALMTIDVLRWLIVRTDLAGTALSMIVKESICLFGALADWLTKAATYGRGSRRSFEHRTARLRDEGVIPQELKAELDWLWATRCNEHFHEVTALEYDNYARNDYNRALRAYDGLRRALRVIYGP